MSAGITGIAGGDGQQWKSEMLAGKSDRKEQINEVAKQFEGILIRQYLDEALKPMNEENGLFGGKSSPMADQLIKDTLTQSITSQNSLGFSSVLQAQLYEEPGTLNTENKVNE